VVWLYAPTIWPRSLILNGEVERAPGRSMRVKRPRRSRRKPCSLAPGPLDAVPSLYLPTIWPRLLMPKGEVPVVAPGTSKRV
jgi:hypothetical protein